MSTKEIEKLVIKFQNKTLPKSEWNHEAHIVVAIWYHMHYDFETALNLIKSNIKSYNESTGTLNTASSGYHETLTIFWMMLTKNFLAYHSLTIIEVAINEFMKSPCAHKDAYLEYYSKGILFSKNARKTWINGDLKQIELEHI